MAIIAEMNKKNDNAFPEGKIILLDGRCIECYPLGKEEEVEIVNDSLKLDTTGKFLVLKKKPRVLNLFKSEPEQPSYEEVQKELFIKNAFYLLAHKERILSDSRMFLCPIHIQNGIAYTGTSGFSKPTLGIYIEWWLNCVGALRTDKKGRRSLVYHLSGSPLSGINHCASVTEQGKKESVTLSPFKNYWPRFIDINTRYTEAKYKYQAYQLQQVLDILKREETGDVECAHVFDIAFMKQEIISLKEQMERLKEDRDNWRSKYYEVVMTYNDAKIRELYNEYKELEANVNVEIETLREQKKTLKVKLKSGCMDNIAYQRQLTPLKKRIQDLKLQLSEFKFNRVREAFPNGDVSFGIIEQYMNHISKEQENEE